MTALEKFLFDTSFDLPDPGDKAAARPEPAAPPVLYTEEDIERARREARAEGHAEGAAEAERRQDDALQASLSALAAELQRMDQATEDWARDNRAQSARMALAVVRKILPSLEEKNALAEIERVVSDVLSRVHDEPRLIVRVSAGVVEAVRRHADETAGRNGFEGRLVCLAEPDFGPSDVRISWADGGAVRDARRLMREVDALAELCFPARAEGREDAGDVPERQWTPTVMDHASPGAADDESSTAAAEENEVPAQTHQAQSHQAT